MDYSDLNHNEWTEPIINSEPSEPEQVSKRDPIAEIAEVMTEEAPVDNSLKKEILETDEEESIYKGIKTTLYKDPNNNIRYKIPTIFSPNPIAKNILSYLENTGFVHILDIGQSGSGKTTWTKYLVHMLHSLKTFQVHWYFRDEIQKLDKIIAGLQKGVSHVVILDDASFTLEELPREKLSELAKRLTYIRHEVKADVIVIMNIHYSKAIKKFFRSVPFTFMTSINMEEVNTFQDVFGSRARYRLRDFAWYFQQMMIKKQWTIELDKWTGKVQTYFTNKPFRLALANEINHLHFFVYLKRSCNLCDTEYTTKRVLDSKDFIQQISDKYGQQRARAMMRMYAFTKHGMKAIDSKRISILNTIAELDQVNGLDWSEIMDELDINSSKKRPRVYIKKDKLAQDIKTLDERIKDREVKEEILDTSEDDYAKQVREQFNEMVARPDLTQDNKKNSESFGDNEPIDYDSIQDSKEE